MVLELFVSLQYFEVAFLTCSTTPDAISVVNFAFSFLTAKQAQRTMDYAGPCHLLDMPLEIRTIIYTYLLMGDSGRVTLCTDVSKAEWFHVVLPQEVPRIMSTKHLQVHFLRTCRQIYNETASVLYGDNTFRSGNVDIFARFLTAIGPKNTALLRQLHLFNVRAARHSFEHGKANEHRLLPSLLSSHSELRNLNTVTISTRLAGLISSETDSLDAETLRQPTWDIVEYESVLIKIQISAWQLVGDDMLSSHEITTSCKNLRNEDKLYRVHVKRINGCVSIKTSPYRAR